MPSDPTNRQQAEDLAIRMAVERLRGACDSGAAAWADRCERLGLLPPDAADLVHLPFLGGSLSIHSHTFECVRRDSGKPAKPIERLLALHYLGCDARVTPEHRWITFREFPGGAFYWEPFRARSVVPLVKVIGNDLGRLRERLSRYAAVIETGTADALSARIVAVGCVEVLLVYRPGDEEFPPSAELLFGACARRVFCAEDAAALGGRVCFGLM